MPAVFGKRPSQNKQGEAFENLFLRRSLEVREVTLTLYGKLCLSRFNFSYEKWNSHLEIENWNPLFWDCGIVGMCFKLS